MSAPPVTRLLVIVHEPLVGDEAVSTLRGLLDGTRGVVHLVAPALATRTQYWFNDRSARQRAVERLERSRATLEAAGIRAEAEVGDSDPSRALDDAVAVHRPQGIVVLSGPTDANWLELGLVNDARRRYGLPVLQLRVDPSGGAWVETASADRPGRAHPVRDLIVVGVLGLAAMLGSAVWFMGPALHVSNAALVGWGVVFDIVPKTIFAIVLWRLYLGRGSGDALPDVARLGEPQHPGRRGRPA